MRVLLIALAGLCACAPTGSEDVAAEPAETEFTIGGEVAAGFVVGL